MCWVFSCTSNCETCLVRTENHPSVRDTKRLTDSSVLSQKALDL